jgi:hypothetical protein
MIKLKDLLKESKFWDHEFGDPLPTLNDVMKKHQQEVLEESPTRLYRFRTKSGSGVPKKEKAIIHKFLDKIWKLFGKLGGGRIEVGTEEMFAHPTYYAIKYQVARVNPKSGKHREWLYFMLDKKYNVVFQAKGDSKKTKAGNLKNINKIAKLLKNWSDEDLFFDKQYGYDPKTNKKK